MTVSSAVNAPNTLGDDEKLYYGEMSWMQMHSIRGQFSFTTPNVLSPKVKQKK